MKEYKKYFIYKASMLEKLSRLNRLKDSALKAGDTPAYLKLCAEFVRLNKHVLAVNQKIKQLMDDINTQMKTRYSKVFAGRDKMDNITAA
jgi:hypothetical protein